MIGKIFVDATDLNVWANRREAQALLPRLLRRLIFATAEPEKIDLPSEESVQLGGWDGILKVTKGNAFVPAGYSAWEVGTNTDIKGKADDDYEKRRREPLGVDPAEAVFIFVTPRRWAGKNKWAADREAEGIWREVRAYDGNDLAAWLEVANGVHIWLSILLGKHPQGVRDISNYWDDWSQATDPHITPALMISGRQVEADRIRKWLSEDPSPLALQADSREEALAFFAAVIYELPDEERERYLARSVVVRDLEPWQQLITSNDPLFLVPMFEERDTIARGVREGHRILVPLGKDDSVSSQTVTLPRVHRQPAKQALLAMGIDEERADDLATLVRRSMMALRRKLAVSPEMQRPAWAKPSEARVLLPIMLAGSWNDRLAADQNVIAKLARTTYEKVNNVLARWANEADPPVRRVGDTWLLVSREDSWVLLAKFLTRDDLENFENVVLEVLGEVDPSFDMPVDQRYLAGVLGKALPYSGLLREGLAETLALMGARSDSPRFSDSVSGQERANRIVRRLLDKANDDWRVWASVSYYLPLLAEASPEVFLDSIEKGLSDNNPVLLNLFSEAKDPLFSHSPHTGLLWALERLAWHPEYLGHAALLLAKLARLDPGGRLGNRPDKSLREIFLCWHPQTAAGLERRLSVLDAIRSREPEVAWSLLCSLLPELHAVAMRTAVPSWREWRTDSHVTYAEIFSGERELVSRLLDDAGMDGKRWSDLIRKAAPPLQKEQQDSIIERLLDLDIESLKPPDKEMLWNTLRRMISRHREFPDADWTMPAQQIDQLQLVYDRIEPQDLTSKYAWLFSARPPHLIQPPGRDWQARAKMLEALMLDAVTALIAYGGLASLLEMASSVEQPGTVGFVLGKNELLADEEQRILDEILGSSEESQRALACGFINGRVHAQGWTWIEAKLSGVQMTAWSPEQRALFFSCLPFENRTWDSLDATDDATQHCYWSRVGLYFLPSDADCERAARKLIEHGRPDMAVDLIALRSHNEQCKVSPSIAVEALEQLSLKSQGVDWGSLQYDIAQVLNLLEASGEIEESRIATLEWAFLPLLQHDRSPKILHRELTRNPDFFVEVFSLACGSKSSAKSEESQTERVRSEYAYILLRSWQDCPGCTSEGSMDQVVTRDWIGSARSALQGTGREERGDERIGQILIHAPHDEDGAWPHRIVRDLLEELSNDDIERGIRIGIYNSRGVVTKSPIEGGGQEKELADQYSAYARQISHTWPRTAAVLRSIAQTYSSEARREDVEAELTEDLWR